MSFKDNLKYAREKNGLSRTQMAEKLDMTPTAYGAYELGKREPKLEKLCQIANILHTTPNDLLNYTPINADELMKCMDICTSVEIPVTKTKDERIVCYKKFTISKDNFIKAVHKAMNNPLLIASNKITLAITLKDSIHDEWRNERGINNAHWERIPLTKEQKEKILPTIKEYEKELKKHPNSEAYIEYYGAPGYIYEKHLMEDPTSEEYKAYFGEEENKNNPDTSK
ncbi:MAG: helix-turn-helix transcriptional regulator [Megasphaera elsdenii]|nr:helix-turn-helix transcriptional regulator [Megasphaera elsdenii]MDY3269452.1 helix-turn-helix transcriptional regulator [Megasphaera elsdenii]